MRFWNGRPRDWTAFGPHRLWTAPLIRGWHEVCWMMWAGSQFLKVLQSPFNWAVYSRWGKWHWSYHNRVLGQWSWMDAAFVNSVRCLCQQILIYAMKEQ
jgi:hypothetical protein